MKSTKGRKELSASVRCKNMIKSHKLKNVKHTGTIDVVRFITNEKNLYEAKKPKTALSNSVTQTKKTQGVKRKFEELNDGEQSPKGLGVTENRKFKKKKREGRDASTKSESSSDHAQNAVCTATSKPAHSQETTTTGVRNKLSVKPDQNWEALLKTLPKAPAKKEMPKKPRKKTWRKPPVKGQKKGQTAQTEVSKTLRDVGPGNIKREDIWWDDVDELLIEGLQNEEKDGTTSATETVNPLVKDHSFAGSTKAVAMDCEMVGVGEDGVDSVLARVSIVNRFGHVLLDKYVKPRERVTDYRTHVSGIRPSDLKNAEDFVSVQKEVCSLLKGRILVGHALHNDLQVLFLDHPRKFVRDTARYKPFRNLFNGRIPSLKNLSAKLLAVEVQSGEHSSVQDAQAAMRIYTMHRAEWEKVLKIKNPVMKMKRKKLKSKTSNIENPLESDSDN